MTGHAPARVASRLLPWLLAAGLLGCGGAPTVPGAGGVDTAAESPDGDSDGAAGRDTDAVARFERRQHDRAEAAAARGDLAEALLAWEVLSTLRPQRDDYRARQVELRQRIQVATAERLPRAQAALRRGELDAAAQLYLEVLALNPGEATAAQGLRQIERERIRRNHVGQFSRDTLMRRPPTEAAARPAPASPRATARATPRNGDRNNVEHASMLASQGELDEAIKLLQAHLAAQRDDAAARRLLAELQARKAARSTAGGRAASATSPW